MEWRARIRFTARQKAELWERWKNGQCVADIARARKGEHDGRRDCASLKLAALA